VAKRSSTQDDNPAAGCCENSPELQNRYQCPGFRRLTVQDIHGIGANLISALCIESRGIRSHPNGKPLTFVFVWENEPRVPEWILATIHNELTMAFIELR
jgi:hypothetical protein